MNNIVQFPQTAAFFLPLAGRCSPVLTDLVIQAATMVQRAEIEAELFKIRLKQKCFVALGEKVPGAVCQVSSEDGPRSATVPTILVFPAEDSEKADCRSLESREPLRFFSGTPCSSVHVVSPAVTPPPVSIDTEAPRLTAPEQHDAFPNGRWTKGEWKL